LDQPQSILEWLIEILTANLFYPKINKLFRIENEREITDVYDFESIIEDTPTTISSFKEYLCIGCLNGLVYTSHYESPQNLYQQSLPPYFGLGASEDVETKEYPDTMITIFDDSYLIWIYSDKTMVFFKHSSNWDFKISYYIQNHAKAIHSIQMLPSEWSEKAFWFISGSSDKTIRKWHVDVSKARFYGTQIRIGMLCDEYSHLKRINKADEDTSDDLGQIRVLKVVKINNENFVFWGDAWGYIWIFNSKDLFLNNIKEIHENEILGIAIWKLQNPQDARQNLIVTCSRDK